MTDNEADGTGNEEEDPANQYRWSAAEFLQQAHDLGSAVLNHVPEVVNNHVRPAVNWYQNQTDFTSNSNENSSTNKCNAC